jgi:hypothetical protein
MMKLRRMRWAGPVIRIGEEKNIYRLLIRKPEGRRLLERPGYRWVDNIKLDLGKIVWGGMDCIGLSQGGDRCEALVNAVMTFVFYKMLVNYQSGYTTGGLSSSTQLHRVS